MQKISRNARRTALGATVGVVVVGAAVGVAGFANAAPTPSPSAPTSGATAPAQPGPGGGHGDRGARGDALAADLATKLKLDQTKVATALREVREANRPTTKPTPGASPTAPATRPDPAAHDAELAKALAPELGVAEATIKTALDEIRAAHAADRAKALADRLAAAVKAGTLTQAEADAVTKAVDKGVIDVGRGPR